MNNMYLPCSSLESGLALSAAIWNLIKPNVLPTDITQYAYPVITDLNGNFWSYLDLDYNISVPAGSTGANLITAISEAVAAGTLASSDVSWIEAQIATIVGNTMAISTLIPPDLISQGLTYDQMVSAGNFNAF